jgi:hypothetical protein
VDWFAHDSGHLLEMMFGWRANPHFGPFHLASLALIGAGSILISTGWIALYQAQRQHKLATTGVYAASAICWLRPRDVRLSSPMADLC